MSKSDRCTTVYALAPENRSRKVHFEVFFYFTKLFEKEILIDMQVFSHLKRFNFNMAVPGVYSWSYAGGNFPVCLRYAIFDSMNEKNVDYYSDL